MKLPVILGFLLGVTGVAQAQSGHENHDMGGMAMPAVVSATVVTGSTDSESVKAFKEADAKMHKAMMATAYTGDADVDFLRGMIPHHQGAVDMAKVVLKFGTDPDVRMLAGDIIKAQETEIRWMNNWLAKHGPTVLPDAKASDARVEVAPKIEAKPVAVVKTESKMQVAATLPVSATVPVSGSLIVTSSLPPVDAISATTAMMQIPANLIPEMPAPDEEIVNTAPQMEFLDGGK